MNWIHTEPPHIKRDNNILNDHVIEGMARADQCAKWLKVNGFTVINVNVGRRNPRIEIQTSRLCRMLQGAIYLTERSHNQPTKRFWVARYFGCEVRWAETENGGAI